MRGSVLIIPLLLFAADARSSDNHLRAQTLSPAVPHLFFQMHKQPASCACTYEGKCGCDGALKFMACIKKSCDSGKCSCKEGATNHFVEACSAMDGQCSKIGLTCGQTEAKCGSNLVAWPSKAEMKKAPVSKVKDVSEPSKDTKKIAKKPAADKKAAKSKGKDDAESKDEDEKAAKDKDEAAKDKEEDEEKALAPVDPDDEEYISKDKYAGKKDKMLVKHHRDFSVGVLCTVLLLCLTISLASSSNAIIKTSTLSIVDTTVVTFLAASWFIVVHHSWDYHNFVGLWKVFAHMGMSIALLMVCLIVSWSLHADTGKLAIFHSIFDYMVMWCNAGFAQTVLSGAGSQTEVLMALFVLVIYYALLIVVFFFVASKVAQRGWCDDTVDYMAGGALASGFVAWVHMVVSGSYQKMMGAAKNPRPPTLNETYIMLICSAVFFTLACCGTPYLSAAKTRAKYWPGRAISVTNNIVILLPYWSIAMSLAHLIVDNLGYSESSSLAQLHLAMASTAVGLFFIFLSAHVPPFKGNSAITDVLLGLGGFIVGAAWCGLLHNSVDEMADGEGYPHPFEVKVIVTGLVTAVVFPTYIFYLKPTITSMSKDV